MNLIAVLLNHNDETCSWQNEGTIVLYKKSDEKWIKIKSIPYFLPLEDCDIDFIKNYYISLFSQLDNCKVFVAKKLSGFLINILEYYQFNIYEYDGSPIDFLDLILNSEKRAKEQKIYLNSQVISIIKPQKIDDNGNYKIDLFKTLQDNQSTTSKKILIPFLQKEKFKCLEVIFDHVPKWFDKILIDMGFTYSTSTNSDNLVNIRISPIQ